MFGFHLLRTVKHLRAILIPAFSTEAGVVEATGTHNNIVVYERGGKDTHKKSPLWDELVIAW